MRLSFIAHRAVFELAGELAHVAEGVNPRLPPSAERRIVEIEALAGVAVRLRVVLEDDAAADDILDAARCDLLAVVGHVPLAEPEVELAILRLRRARADGRGRSLTRRVSDAERYGEQQDGATLYKSGHRFRLSS